MNIMNSIERVDNYTSKVSYHYPVRISISLPLVKRKTKQMAYPKSCKINWDKVDKSKYRNKISCEISNVNVTSIQSRVESLNTTLKHCAEECAPKQHTIRNAPKLKGHVTGYTCCYKREETNLRQNGNNCDRPSNPTNLILIEKKLTTSKLHKHIRIEVAKIHQKDKNEILLARERDTVD